MILLENIMKYLPYENLAFKSRLSSTEILGLIRENIEPSREGNSSKRDRNNSYKGKIIGQSFEMKRVINYRNSFLPRIKGEIKQVADETIVNIKMKLQLFVLIFFIFWFAGVLIGLAVFLLALIGKGQLDVLIFGPLGMLIFGYGLVTGGFKYESSKSKKYLKELFEAELKD